MAATPIIVCQYNMGATVSDYSYLCKHTDPSSVQFKSQAEADQFTNVKYVQAQRKTAELLRNGADVYLLQEVGDLDRIVPKALDGYVFVHQQDRPVFDCAIALNPARFSHIQNHTTPIRIAQDFIKEVAIATAIDNQTGEQVAFASAHVPGFSFDDRVANDIAEGDVYCAAIAQRLSEVAPNALQVLGADMNGHPDNAPTRFGTFNLHHYELLRTNQPTNVNTRDVNEKEREIDFFFMRHPLRTLCDTIASIFCNTIGWNADILHVHPLGEGWNSYDNASDHKPIFMAVTPYIAELSLIGCIWDAICAFFANCCGCAEPNAAPNEV